MFLLIKDSNLFQLWIELLIAPSIDPQNHPSHSPFPRAVAIHFVYFLELFMTKFVKAKQCEAVSDKFRSPLVLPAQLLPTFEKTLYIFPGPYNSPKGVNVAFTKKIKEGSKQRTDLSRVPTNFGWLSFNLILEDVTNRHPAKRAWVLTTVSVKCSRLLRCGNL